MPDAAPRVWADDVVVAFAPAAAYRRLIERGVPAVTWRQALRRPALVLLVTGTSLAIAATGRVTITLVASTMLAASFAIAVQLTAAAMLVTVCLAGPHGLRRARPALPPASRRQGCAPLKREEDRAQHPPVVGIAAAVDLAFVGHLPWSLWVLAVGAWAAADVGFPLAVMGLTMAAPLVWNGVILAAFCREVLAAEPRAAWLWTLAHQSVIWAFGVSFTAWISGGWFRLLNP